MASAVAGPSSLAPRTGTPGTPDDGRQGTSRNPISSRLYKVLGSSYDDPATREALETLSDLYAIPEVSKGRTISRFEDVDEEFGSGRPLDYAGLAAKARKTLRRDAELRLSKGTKQFLSAFQQVDKELDSLQEHIETMRSKLAEAQSQLAYTNESCRSLLERAGGLSTMRQSVGHKQAAIDKFLVSFTLTQEEAELLESKDLTINECFFRTMSKAEKIVADARVLMAGDDGPTKVGVDIIETTSRQLEQGFEKVSRWCTLESRQFVRDVPLEVNSYMSEGVKWLWKRPDLLSESLSILASTRQAALLRLFTDALTRGGPGGMPRPIELHAHDPMRYVGDMLAWVHQAIAGEREFLDALIGTRSERRMVGSIRTFGKSEQEECVREMMDRAFDKLRTPLRTRVRQTVRSQESCIVSYKVANLLSFYNLTLKRTVGEMAGISTTINEATEEAYKVFFDTIEAQARALARTLLPEEQDTQPPSAFLDNSQVLRELMAVYQSSLLGDETEDDRRAGFQAILDLMVDAAVNMCVGVSEARHVQKPKWDKDVFMLNCLTHLTTIMRNYDFADYKVVTLKQDIDTRANLLVTDHYRNLLREASLEACLAVCDNKTTDEPISRLGAMQPSALQSSLRSFAVWLSEADVVHPPRLAALFDQRIAERVHRAALVRLVQAYATICAEVRKPENRYEAANTLLGAQRPFGQLAALRAILGLGEEDSSSYL